MKKRVKIAAFILLTAVVILGIKPFISSIKDSMAASGNETKEEQEKGASEKEQLVREILGDTTSTVKTLTEEEQKAEAEKIFNRKPSYEDLINILEIVPSNSMGELGYLVGGYEPIQGWEEGLKMFNDASTRNEKGIPDDWMHSRKSYVSQVSSGSVSFINKALSIDYKEYLRKKDYDALPSEGDRKQYDGYLSPEQEEQNTANGKYKKLVTETEETMQKGYFQNQANFYQDYSQVIKEGEFSPNSKGNYNVIFQYNKPSKVIGTYSVLTDMESEAQNGNYDKARDENGEEYYVYNPYGTGNYNVAFTPDPDGTYYVKEYEKTNAEQGSYQCNIKEADYILTPGKGDFKWVEDESAPDILTDHNASNVYVGEYNITIPKEWIYYTGEIDNNEWFKEHVLDYKPKDFDKVKVSVTTVTPKQLNQLVKESTPEGGNFFKNFHLIYMSGDGQTSVQNTAYVQAWEWYSKEGLNLDKSERAYKDYLSSTSPSKSTTEVDVMNDLNWETTEQIFQQVGVEQSCAIIMNSEIRGGLTWANGSSNNMYKLFLMLTHSESSKQDLNTMVKDNRKEIEEINEMLENSTIFPVNVNALDQIIADDLTGRTTGEYKNLVKWPHDIFCKDSTCKDGFMADSQYVMDNVYVMDGSQIYNNDFVNDNKYTDKGHFNQAMEHNKTDRVSPAQVIKYILAASQIPNILILNEDAIHRAKDDVILYLDYDIVDPDKALNIGDTYPIQYMVTAKKSLEEDIEVKILPPDKSDSSKPDYSSPLATPQPLLGQEQILNFDVNKMKGRNFYTIHFEAKNTINNKVCKVKCTLIRRSLFNLE